MIVGDRRTQLGVYIDLLSSELDVPTGMNHQLTAAYDELTGFVCKDATQTGAEIYSQGSRRIGTMVRPVKEDDDYDVDLVFRRDVRPASTTKEQLKQWVGQQLRAFVAAKRRSTPKQAPKLSESARCWTLTYPGGFHLDVLPAIPNDAQSPRDSILITDRELHQWQVSNPREYAGWFLSRSERSFREDRTRLAKSRGVKVEAIPDHEVRTPLHRAVQLLKRHRDLRFEGDSDDKPASILITTLAGIAYAHGDSLYEAVGHVFSNLLNGIEVRDDGRWVANPVDAGENFADRWLEHPKRAEVFIQWAQTAKTDFARIDTSQGIPELTKSLGSAFGESAANRATLRLGAAARSQRERGELSVSGGGTLGATGYQRVRDHTFYGA